MLLDKLLARSAGRPARPVTRRNTTPLDSLSAPTFSLSASKGNDRHIAIVGLVGVVATLGQQISLFTRT